MQSVCFVTQEIPQLYANGGAGTATMGFAEALADAGFSISILYTSTVPDFAHARRCAAALAERGISLHFIDKESIVPNYNADVSYLSFAVFRWLRGRHFDVVHFNDFGGLAFYSIQAKRCDLALQNATICVFAHGPTLWAYDINEAFYDEHFLMADFMERQSFEFADHVLAPSHYILDFIRAAGVSLPESIKIQRGVLPEIVPSLGSSKALPIAPRKYDIVFFGRHEVRKGFLIFIDALAELLAKRDDICVTFLGREGDIYGQNSRILAEARLGEFADRISFLPLPDRDSLRAKLTTDGVLAVIPSLDENLPNTVFECLQWGVNFIASNVGGIPELLDRATAQDRLFSPNYSALVAKIEDILTKPRPAAKLAFDPAAEKCGYVDWHSRLEVNRKVRSPEKPLVTICVVHFDRPQYLTQALSSINSQTYPNIEVVVVDDGSRTSEARQKLKSIATSRHRFPVKIVHTPDVGLGAARNAGVKQANGDFVLFMDDDNVAIPEMTERFVAAIQSSNSDVVTGLASIFEGDDFPTDQMMSHVFYLPLGGAINLGMFRNSYGDAHAIWKRSTLEALNGFIETRAPAEDWELFARACLKGYQVSVVPEQLHWRRVHKQSLSARPFSRWKQYIQIADTYAEYPPADLRPILRAGQFYLSFAKVKPEGPSQRGLPTVAKPRRRPLFLRILRRIALVILSWPIIANPLKRLVRAFMAELRS